MWEEYLKAAIEAANLAKVKIMEIYDTDFDVEIKSDNSPVTLADKSADKIIKDYLKEKFPDTAFLTEESDDDLSRLEKDIFLIKSKGSILLFESHAFVFPPNNPFGRGNF